MGPPGLRLQRVHKTFSPQIVRGNVLGRSADDVQTVCDVVKSVEDQVPVQVECHARGGVPKHTLLLCALRRRDAGPGPMFADPADDGGKDGVRALASWFSC